MNPNEQQEAQQPVAPQPVEQVQAQSQSQLSLSKVLLILFGVLVVLGLMGGSYYLGTKQQGSVSMVSYTKQVTATPTNTPAPTADPTVNWKAFTDISFSIKYPNNWTASGDAGSIEFYDPMSMQKVVGNGGGIMQVPQQYVNISIFNIADSPKSYVDKLFTTAPYSTDTQSMQSRKSIVLNGYSAEVYLGTGEGSEGYDIIVSDGKNHLFVINIPTNYPTADKTISQMLSTFKFTQ